MKVLFPFLLLLYVLPLSAQKEYVTETDIHYYPDAVNRQDAYINGRCVLDIYYPIGAKDYATIVWFHGGGITAVSYTHLTLPTKRIV